MFCGTSATYFPTKEIAYRVNNILQLLDICQSTIPSKELSIKNILSIEKQKADFFTKTPCFNSTFQIPKYTEELQKFLIMFNFEHSQITQKKFAQSADL